MNAHSLLFKIKRLDAQMIAVILATPMAAALLAYLISLGATDLICANWFISIIAMPAFLSTQISAFGHLGRIRDMYSSTGFNNSPFELIGAVTGVMIGILFAAVFALVSISVPLLPHLGFAAYLLASCRLLNVFAGIGNRLGRCADKNSRPFNEKIIVAAGATFGLGLSIALFATNAAAMVSVVGVTAFFTAGIAIPFWFAGVIFIASITSAFISNADYGSKAYNFIRTLIDENCDVAKRVQRFKAEYSGSLFGLCVGATLGIITTISLAILTPYILPGIIGIVTGALIVISTASLVATVCSQVGRIIDNFRAPAPTKVKPLEKHISLFTILEHEDIDERKTVKKQAKTTYQENFAAKSTQTSSGLFNANLYNKTCERTPDLLPCSDQIKTPQARHDFTTSSFTPSPRSSLIAFSPF